jgi:thiosulfate reductase cytochrome b subunit
VRRELVPRAGAPDDSYNALQRLAYFGVVFIGAPLAIVTGLGMSPAIASVVPALADTLGGQQSARTIHFFVAVAFVVFVIVHIVMVTRAGFVRRTRAMITGWLE